jgi:hypothetical protein
MNVGLCIGLREGIALDLESKFGPDGPKPMPQIETIYKLPKLPHKLPRFASTYPQTLDLPPYNNTAQRRTRHVAVLSAFFEQRIRYEFSTGA